MRGVIAEAHYDGGRNMVAMIRGRKRYILNPPKACKHLGIIASKKHPSFRHSVFDWSDANQAVANNFDKVDSIDTILNAGEILYIPSYWIHYIISMEFSAQCNSRSGLGPQRDRDIISECIDDGWLTGLVMSQNNMISNCIMFCQWRMIIYRLQHLWLIVFDIFLWLRLPL